MAPPTRAVTAAGVARAVTGAAGKRPVCSEPRVGSRSPRRNSTTRITTSGSASRTPGSGAPWALGNQVAVAATYCTTDCSPAMAKAAATVMPNDASPPSSAAPSAGMMRKVMVAGSIDALTVAASTPNDAANTAERTQFTAASRSGERPMRTAPFSSSDAARVASPKRVNRNTAHSAAVTRTTIAPRTSWSRPTVVPSRCNGRLSNTGRTATVCDENRSTTAA